MQTAVVVIASVRATVVATAVLGSVAVLAVIVAAGSVKVVAVVVVQGKQ